MNHTIKGKALQPIKGKPQRRLLAIRNIRCARKRWKSPVTKSPRLKI